MLAAEHHDVGRTVTTTGNLSGVAQLSTHGRALVALSMFDKGVSFVGAAVLLAPVGHRYVVRHLVCQGLELVGKALLLFRNYDKYKAKLRSPFGHNLETLADTLVTEFSLNPRSTAFAGELKQLNQLYKNHLLRYGSIYDALVDPGSIPFAKVFRSMRAAVRLAMQHLPPDVLATAEQLGMRQ
jgi:hypothetical protein